MKNRFETITSSHERNTAMKRFLLLSIPLLMLFLTACPTTTPPTATKPTINSFTATPPSLPAGGGSVTLGWDVKDAKSLSVDGGVGAVTGTSKTVSVTSTKTFTLTATNDEGSATQTTSVSVGAGADTTPPTVISVEPPDGATGVIFTSNIVITFSEKMDQVATQSAYQSATLPADQVTFSWNAEGTVLTVDPKGDLLYARGADINALAPLSYDFNLGATAKDSAGNALESVSSSFSTLRRIDTNLPAVCGLELCGTAYSNNIFDATNSAPRVGDSLYGADNTNVVARAFFTFDLSAIPNSVKDVDLEIAEVTIYKNSVIGNPYVFGSIYLDHVNYGATTDNSSGAIFNTPSLANLGLADDASQSLGYRARDATSAVRNDLTNRAARGNRSQYRLAFPGTQVSQNNQQDFVFFSDFVPQDPYLRVIYLIP
jgi:Bacterial Ig-like domain